MVEARIQPPTQAQPAVSDDDKAKNEAAAAAELAAHPNKGQFVLYKGPRNAEAAADELRTRAPKLGEGTVAEITATQWREAGVDAKRDHVWNLSNNWQIPATQFTQEQIEYLQANSKRFELVDGNGEKVES